MSVNEEASSTESEEQSAAIAAILKGSLRLGKDAFGRSQIFGEPIHSGDVTVVPVGSMRGGAGGGAGSGPLDPESGKGSKEGEPTGSGSGIGWGMVARAHGAIVIQGENVRYLPALDVNRIVVAGVVGLVATVVLAPRIIRAAKR